MVYLCRGWVRWRLGRVYVLWGPVVFGGGGGRGLCVCVVVFERLKRAGEGGGATRILFCQFFSSLFFCAGFSIRRSGIVLPPTAVKARTNTRTAQLSSDWEGKGWVDGWMDGLKTRRRSQMNRRVRAWPRPCSEGGERGEGTRGKQR